MKKDTSHLLLSQFVTLMCYFNMSLCKQEEGKKILTGCDAAPSSWRNFQQWLSSQISLLCGEHTAAMHNPQLSNTAAEEKLSQWSKMDSSGGKGWALPWTLRDLEPASGRGICRAQSCRCHNHQGAQFWKINIISKHACFSFSCSPPPG